MMPSILPEHINANWPKDEGTIGVVGVAPWATLDFCRKIYEFTHATKDWNYPRIIIDANSKIPSRGRHLQLGERDPSPFIKSTINELADMGATVAVVPCNTAHILFEKWGTNTQIPVISIIEASVSQLQSIKHLKAVLLGSQHLVESQIFQHAIRKAGHTAINIRPDEQNTVNQCIAHLKRTPYLLTPQRLLLQSLISRLIESEVDAVFLACTELSIISRNSIWGSLFVIDSNEALAIEALKGIKQTPLSGR